MQGASARRGGVDYRAHTDGVRHDNVGAIITGMVYDGIMQVCVLRVGV